MLIARGKANFSDQRWFRNKLRDLCPNPCGLEEPEMLTEKLARIAFFFRIQQFGETWVFLQEIEILVVTRMVTIG